MVSDLLSEFDLLDKWSKNGNSGGKLNCGGSDCMQNFHKGTCTTFLSSRKKLLWVGLWLVSRP